MARAKRRAARGRAPDEILEWRYDRTPFLQEEIRLGEDDFMTAALYALDTDQDGLVLAPAWLVQARAKRIAEQLVKHSNMRIVSGGDER